MQSCQVVIHFILIQLLRHKWPCINNLASKDRMSVGWITTLVVIVTLSVQKVLCSKNDSLPIFVIFEYPPVYSVG